MIIWLQVFKGPIFLQLQLFSVYSSIIAHSPHLFTSQKVKFHPIKFNVEIIWYDVRCVPIFLPEKMSATKVMAVLVLVLAVAMAVSTDGNKNKTNSSHAQHVGSLVAKARLSPVNATVNNTTNSTESNNSTAEKTVTKRSDGSIDKSDGTRWRLDFS